MPRDPFSHGENPTVPIPYMLLFLTELFRPQDRCGSDNHLKMPYLLLLPWREFVNHLRGPGRVENRQLIGKILHPIDFGLKSSHVAYSFGVTNLYLQLSPFTSSYCEWVLRLQVLKKWQVWRLLVFHDQTLSLSHAGFSEVETSGPHCPDARAQEPQVQTPRSV